MTSTQQLVQVGVVGPARGLRGEVLVRPTTDEPEARFAPGAIVSTEDGETIEVVSSREISGRLCVFFAGWDTREAAEARRGCRLYAPARDDDDDEYYAFELAGMTALSPDGRELGTISGIQQGAYQDLLNVATPAGPVFVPFVHDLVPTIDREAGHVVIDAPDGLFGEEA
ncbi:16S rRNA processing protein RimM [Nanchangia anserum]|uniref:Ribosome maturation factor RimM n=1 Tax=Nanchangia anserum TaxID=2692125 RepID=A0A8I0G722_9ACTO|nr:ribosome maturation factor RimM [Nanchangia anserum]MBD3688997.1 16S rRNA processing protein RimM [Nanchangia anserum]QOX81245.1 16S rRNA processing protein RimM [Nanchangia anserum]